MFTSRVISRSIIGFCLFAALGESAQADAPAFLNVSQDDLNKITKEFSGTTSLHSVMPPSSLGSVFGVEVGAVGGLSKSAEIEKIVKEVSPNTEFGHMPHAGLLGAVSVPFGITGEFSLIPEVDTGDLKYQQLAAALKWTLSDMLLPGLPVNVAVRGFLSTTKMSFAQTITDGGTPVNATVKYEGRVTGLQLLASPSMIPMIEPYAGVGFLSASGDLSVSGTTTATLFDFTAAKSAKSSPTTSQFLVGVNVRLLVLVLGVEYAHDFTDSYTAKLSMRF